LGHGASDGKQLPHDGAPLTEQMSGGTGVRHSLTMKKLLLEFGIIQIIFKLTLCVRLLLVYKRLQSFFNKRVY